MIPEFQQTLQKYAELIVKMGLNLQPGQRLLIIGPMVNAGVSLQAAPLVRLVAASAYASGARLVDVLWGDEEVLLARFRHAPPDSFENYPTWHSDTVLDYARHGDAVLTILANDPDLLSSQAPDQVATLQKVSVEHNHAGLEYIMRNATNWAVVSASAPAWAAKVFPDTPQAEQEARLWATIFETCRVNLADPIAAWQKHIDDLTARSDYLNRKRYTALKYSAPGTDLTVGLPPGHLWESGRSTSESGLTFTCNLPTEEVFTLPHKDQVEGTVRASLPLSYGSALIENFSLTFTGGRVVSMSADKGETILRKLLETDEGAGRLGEVALVPHSSPVSRSGLLFYNTLFDENAASHLALGQAYRSSLRGADTLSDDAFAAVGGNHSLVHVDFMIGSGEMNVDGIAEDGTVTPVMRSGEWAFDV